jgi:hypothetical protein
VSVIDRIFPAKADSAAPASAAAAHVPSAPATGSASAPAARQTSAPVRGGAPAELVARRDRLAEQLATLQWDLGGLAYEMAVRDHFRLDVLVRVAARLQEVDAELGEVERLLRMEDAGAGGECPSCGALHGRGAMFCWQCGHQLMPTGSPDFHNAVTAGSHPPSQAIR